MKCLPCGQDNASSALFCTACRRPLVSPSKVPTRLEPVARPAMAMAGAAAPIDSSYGGAAGVPSERNRFAPPEAGRASRMGSDSDILTEDEAWAAIIGDANTHHYLTRFERLARGDSGGWHWPAFFITWYWMLYRKMWVPAVLYFFAPWVGMLVIGIVAAASPGLGVILYLAQWVAILVVPGLMANAWYFKHCENKIRDVRARGGSKDQIVARLEAAGGTSSVVVIIVAVLGIICTIGILAAVALPAYQTYTVKAKVVDALPVAYDVAAEVGKVYEQTGTLPAQSDVDIFRLRAPHQSKFVGSIDLDNTSGMLTLKINSAGQAGEGAIHLVPSSDNNHHLTWACTAGASMKRFVPASCSIENASTR